MITIAETEPFQKKVKKLLSTEEKEDLIDYLAENPTSGDLIKVKKKTCCQRLLKS